MKSKLLGVSAALALLAAMSPASAAVNLLTNSGFDDVSVAAASAGLSFPYVTLPNYAYPGGPGGLGTVGSWTYVDGASGGGGGLVGYPPVGEPHFEGPAPLSGNQYAFLQNNGSLSQTFNSSGAGLTTISWNDAGRQSGGHGDQIYQVLLNSVVIGTFVTIDSQPFTFESVLGTLVAGSNTLTFAGLTTLPADQTAFLEDVSVTSAVPELSTWAMMLIGFAGCGLITYRRSRNGIGIRAAA